MYYGPNVVALCASVAAVSLIFQVVLLATLTMCLGLGYGGSMTGAPLVIELRRAHATFVDDIRDPSDGAFRRLYGWMRRGGVIIARARGGDGVLALSLSLSLSLSFTSHPFTQSSKEPCLCPPTRLLGCDAVLVPVFC